MTEKYLIAMVGLQVLNLVPNWLSYIRLNCLAKRVSKNERDIKDIRSMGRILKFNEPQQQREHAKAS
jgi:hypothetical protein